MRNREDIVVKRLSQAKRPNNHNAGELLTPAFFEVCFGHKVLGNWGHIRQPAIA